MTSKHKREITLPHRSILIQQVDKAYHVIEEKLSAGQKQHSISELAKLWKNVFHSSEPVTGLGSCKAILALVGDGKLTISDALEKIVSCSASATQFQWLVFLTLKLLKLQFFKCADACETCTQLCFSSPYQLRLHTHPLISIVTASPQSWESVLSEIQSLLFECSVSGSVTDGSCTVPNAIEILKPFLLYVFFNPLNETSCMFQISTLCTTLVNHLSCFAADIVTSCDHKELNIVTFLTNVLSSVKLTEVSLQLFMQLSIAMQSSSLCNKSHLITNLCLYLLSSCLALIHTHKLTSAANFLYSFIQSSLLHIEQVDIILIGLAHLLCESTVDTVKWLLYAALEILKSPHWVLINGTTRLLCLFTLKASVLPLLLNKSTLGFQSVLPLVSQLLKSLDDYVTNVNKENDSDQSRVKLYLNVELGAPLLNVNAMLHAFQTFKENEGFANFYFIMQLHRSHAMALDVALSACGILLSYSTMKLFDDTLHDKCLQLLNQVSLAYPELTLMILPTIFYAMKREESSSHHRNLVLMLPKFATHADCVAPILATIQAFCKVPTLHPLAIYLLLEMWKKQERTFPYLQKVMSQTFHFNPVLENELNIVKAVAIKEMCVTRPFRNTSELLALISSMLSPTLHPGHVIVLVDGLYNLVLHEVVNLRSMWNELKEKLLAYQSNTVIAAALKMLSLLPKHEDNTPSFLQFKDETLCWIWQKLEHQSIEVVAAALVCLSHFKKEDFLNKHLPEKFRPQRVELNEESLDDFLMQPIPGSCYLKVIDSQIPIQAQYFLSSLLEQEIEDLPRDIKHRALQAQQKSKHSNVLSDLPSYILKMYEKNKQPNLKSAFATSVLMSYNPGTDDASPKTLVSLGRNALQHLQALLSEVTVDPKNWKLMLWLANAWTMFMQKCFKTMVNGREAELHMQLKQKSCEKEDVMHKLDNIDFWCRDKITDLLKTTSKGTPGMQGNSVLALAGLIHAIRSHKLKMEEISETENESTGYLSYDHWIGMAVDTIISIVDSNYHPSGRIFSWCQYKAVSQTGRLTTSKIGEVCAMNSFAVFLPALLPHDSQRIASVVQVLYKPIAKLSNVHTSPDYEPNPITMMNLYLSLGSVMAKLYSEKVHEVCNTALNQQLEECIRMLTKSIFESVKAKADGESDGSSDDEVSEMFIGSLLGVGQLLPSLFLSGNAILQEKAAIILKSLEDQIDQLEEQSYGYLEAYFASLSWSYVGGRMSLAVKGNSDILTKIHNKLSENKNNAVLSQSLGDVCFAMHLDGDAQASSLFHDLFQQWLKQAMNDRLPTRQKLASICGLASLVGSESIFMPQLLKYNQQAEENLIKIVKLLQRLTSNVKDSGMSGNSALLLGHLYLSSQSASRPTSSMPSSYSYLPESSILQPMYATLTDMQTNEGTDHACTITATVISSLAATSTRLSKPFPPVNWSVPLTSLLHMNLSKKEQTACFVIAITQCKENQTAVTFLINWMQPALFKTLELSTQCLVFKSLHLLIRSLPSVNVLPLMDFAERISHDSPLLVQSILLGLLSSLRMDDLPQGIPNRLFALTNHFIENHSLQIDDNQQVVNQWRLIADNVALCQDGGCIEAYAKNPDLALKILFVKCHLVSQGSKPLQCLNDTLKVCASSENLSLKKSSLFMMNHYLQSMLTSKTDQTCLNAFKQWVQELMGSIRKLSSNDVSSIFFTKLFAVAIITWNKTTGNNQDKLNGDEFSFSTATKTNFLWDYCLNLMSPALQELLLQTTWEEALTYEIMDCLLSLYQHNFKDDSPITTCIRQILLNLHQHNVFTKKSSWTTVVSALFL